MQDGFRRLLKLVLAHTLPERRRHHYEKAWIVNFNPKILIWSDLLGHCMHTEIVLSLSPEYVDLDL